MIRSVCIWLVILLMACSCSSGGDTSNTHQFRVFEEDGITIAETTGGPRYEGELFRYEESLVLHSDPAVEESLLHRPSGMVISDDGRIFICDAGDRRIAVFSPAGEFIRNIGREGSGPGEFRYLNILGIHSGQLLIHDSSLNRLTVYSLEGELQEVHTPRSLAGVNRFYPGPDDTFIGLDATSKAVEPDFWQGMRALIVNSAGDTLVTVEADPRPTSRMISAPLPVSFPVYYSDGPEFDYYPEQGILGYDSIDPELRWYDFTGAIQQIIRIGFPRELVTSAHRDRVKADWDDRIAVAGDASRESMKAVRENLAYGEFVPFWRTATVDDTGYYWLQRYELRTERLAAGGGSLFSLLSPDGEYLGDTRWPVSVTSGLWLLYPTISQGCLVATITDEETGEERVTVFSLKPAVDGLRYPY
ncbi:6-bladed beta-propeller [Gemmatimonadota bacterium]